MGQSTHRDSALHTAEDVENAGRPTISRWCGEQLGASRWTGGHQGMAVQFMMLGKMTSPSFDSVKINYLNFDNVKSVIFMKSKSSTSQRRPCITYKTDSGADGNIIEALFASKNKFTC